MADKSAIEWTEATWNPVTGCSKVSPGCDHCYAETLSLRTGWSKKPWTHENAAENVVLHPERLDQPLRWRKPRMIFVNSMSDLFHELVPDDFIEQVFVNMARAPRHTFQVLTKRPDRARKLLSDFRTRNFIVNRSTAENTAGARARGYVGMIEGAQPAWPLPNVWMGVSIESWRFNWRANVLRQVPAAVRFISAEPLLDTLYPGTARDLNLNDIDWIIVGGESGHGFRPMNMKWAREIREAVLGVGTVRHDWPEEGMRVVNDAARPALFFKQVGGRTPKVGGRILDGVEWNEMPKVTA